MTQFCHIMKSVDIMRFIDFEQSAYLEKCRICMTVFSTFPNLSYDFCPCEVYPVSTKGNKESVVNFYNAFPFGTYIVPTYASVNCMQPCAQWLSQSRRLVGIWLPLFSNSPFQPEQAIVQVSDQTAVFCDLHSRPVV